jgi:hypothetical protein
MNDDKIDTLTKQRDQLNNRIRLIKNKEQTAKRKRETRAKIILGASVIAGIKSGRIKSSDVKNLVSAYSNERDIALVATVLPPE